MMKDEWRLCLVTRWILFSAFFAVSLFPYLWTDAEHLQRWRDVQGGRNLNVAKIYSESFAPDAEMAQIEDG